MKPPFLFPPRGRRSASTPSPVGEGWEGGKKIISMENTNYNYYK
jgi:hypothetical protein